MTGRFLVLCGVAVLAFSQAATAEIRKWTARAGNFSTEAELIDVKEGNAVLQKRDGISLSVPLDRLSLADVRYIENFLRDATAAIGKPVGAPDGKSEKGENVEKAETPAKALTKTTDNNIPLTRPNSSQWQVRPDPGPSVSIRDASISLSDEFGSGEMLIPATPSRFIGYFSSSRNGMVQAWDVQTGDRIGPLTLEGHPHPAPAMSPDGDLIAVFMLAVGKPKFQVWSLRKKSLVKEINLGENAHPSFFQFAGPKRLLVSKGFGRGLSVLDPRTGVEIAKVDIENHGIMRSYAVSPGGIYLVSPDSHRGPMKIYDLRNGEQAGQLDFDGDASGTNISGLRFSADGQELAALRESPKTGLFCWSMKTGKIAVQHEFSRSLHELAGFASGNSLDFIPGGKGWLINGRAVVDRDKGGPIWSAKSNPGRDAQFIRMLDGERMLVASGSYGNRRLTTERLPWDEISKSAAVVEKGGTAKDAGLPPLTNAKVDRVKEVKLLPQMKDWKVPADVSADGQRLKEDSISVGTQLPIGDSTLIAPLGSAAVMTNRISASKAGETEMKLRFRRFDLKTGKEEPTLEVGHACKAIDVNAEGTRLLLEVSESSDRLDVYDLTTNKHVAGFRPYAGGDSFRSKVKWAAMVGSDRVLTLSNDGTLRLWSLPGCEAIYECEITKFHSALISPSRRLAIVPSEGAYQAIDTATGEQLGTLKAPQFDQGRALTGYDFSPDGKMLAAVFWDTKNAGLVCWDLTKGEIKHQHELKGGQDVTWMSDSRLLIHHPLAEDRTVRVYQFPIRRYDLMEAATGRILWRYQLPVGQFGSQRAGGLVWYVSAKAFGTPSSLNGAVLPSSATAAKMASAPPPKNLLPAGTSVTLDVKVSITGDALADKVMQDDVKKKIAEQLAKRGLKVEERTALALRVTLRETLTGNFLELRPILGSVAGRYQVRGKTLTCSLELTDVTRQGLWSNSRTIPMKQEIPRTGIPMGTAPDDFVRQQQWTDAMDWITGSGLPAEVFEGWAYSGMGESVLAPTGETLLTVDFPTP